MYYILWLRETILALYSVWILYVLYFMAAGNHTSLVWCTHTICITFYGGGKPYQAGMVWRYYMYYILWLRETILDWHGVWVLYVL
jgi:hypothetical protein